MLLQKNSNKVLVICGKQARRAKDDQISDSDFWPFIENPPHNLLSFDISTISNIDLRKSKSPLRTNKGIIRPSINIFQAIKKFQNNPDSHSPINFSNKKENRSEAYFSIPKNKKSFQK